MKATGHGSRGDRGLILRGGGRWSPRPCRPGQRPVPWRSWSGCYARSPGGATLARCPGRSPLRASKVRVRARGRTTSPYSWRPSFLATLAAPAGVGVVGPGANAHMRALLVELLTGGTRVVIGRNELNRLFEGASARPTWPPPSTGPLRRFRSMTTPWTRLWRWSPFTNGRILWPGCGRCGGWLAARCWC